MLGKNEYIQYRHTNPNKGAVVYIQPSDLLNDTLFNDIDNNKNEFNLLIIADYINGTDEDIINKITPEGVNVLKRFINQGGFLLTSGKSGYLLELMGTINKGSYNTSKFITTSHHQAIIDIKGCDNIQKLTVTESHFTFEQHLLCMNVNLIHIY